MGKWVERLVKEYGQGGVECFKGVLSKKEYIIAGSGPSLLTYPRHQMSHRLFLVNHAQYKFPDQDFGCCFESTYTIANQVKVCFTGDGPGTSAGTLLTVPLYKDGLWQRIPRPPHIHSGVRSDNMRDYTRYGLHSDLNRGIYVAHTSVHPAIQILMYTGVKKIGLIGVDLKNTDKTHFFGEVEDKRNEERESWFDSCLELFENITPRLKEEFGVTLVNLSPISRLKEVMDDKSGEFYANQV